MLSLLPKELGEQKSEVLQFVLKQAIERQPGAMRAKTIAVYIFP